MQTEWFYVVVMWVEVCSFALQQVDIWCLEIGANVPIANSQLSCNSFSRCKQVISKTYINPIYHTILSYNLTLNLKPLTPSNIFFQHVANFNFDNILLGPFSTCNLPCQNLLVQLISKPLVLIGHWSGESLPNVPANCGSCRCQGSVEPTRRNARLLVIKCSFVKSQWFQLEDVKDLLLTMPNRYVNKHIKLRTFYLSCQLDTFD
jgi:hypothetical protein